MENKTVLVCIAHPDDEIFCSGTILRLRQTNNRVVIVVATDGEKGSHDPDSTPESIANMRREEMTAAASLLGVAEVVHLGFHDGELEHSPELKETLFRTIRQHKPDVLLTFDPWKRYEIHSDHRTIGFAAIEAAHLGANCWYFQQQLSEDVSCHKCQELYLFNCDEPNYYVDITPHFEMKLAAASAHASQFGQQDVTADRLRYILNQPNAQHQLTIEPLHKMYLSDLHI